MRIGIKTKNEIIYTTTSELSRAMAMWKTRMDDDGEEEGESKGTKKSHGNTRLPYGLCNREGIDTKGMTPKDAWNALEGKGYNVKDEYKKLKERNGNNNQQVAETEEQKQAREKKGRFSHILKRQTQNGERDADEDELFAVRGWKIPDLDVNTPSRRRKLERRLKLLKKNSEGYGSLYESDIKESERYLEWLKSQPEVTDDEARELVNDPYKFAASLLPERNTAEYIKSRNIIKSCNDEIQSICDNKRYISEQDEQAYQKAVEKKRTEIKKILPTIESCKTYDDIDDYMFAAGFTAQRHEKIGDGTVIVYGYAPSYRFDGMNIKCARDAAQSLIEMAEKIPYAKTCISKISEYDKSLVNGSKSFYAFEYVGQIQFNSKYFESREGLADQYKFDVSETFHPKDTNEKAILQHETAHCIATRIDAAVGYGYVTSYVRQQAELKFGYGVCNKVSRYAAKNSNEFFAEAISAYVQGVDGEVGEICRFVYDTTAEYAKSKGVDIGLRQDAEDGDWVTINGTHVLVGENGTAMNGGKLKGMDLSCAKSQRKQGKSNKLEAETAERNKRIKKQNIRRIIEKFGTEKINENNFPREIIVADSKEDLKEKIEGLKIFEGLIPQEDLDKKKEKYQHAIDNWDTDPIISHDEYEEIIKDSKAYSNKLSNGSRSSGVKTKAYIQQQIDSLKRSNEKDKALISKYKDKQDALDHIEELTSKQTELREQMKQSTGEEKEKLLQQDRQLNEEIAACYNYTAFQNAISRREKQIEEKEAEASQISVDPNYEKFSNTAKQINDELSRIAMSCNGKKATGEQKNRITELNRQRYEATKSMFPTVDSCEDTTELSEYLKGIGFGQVYVKADGTVDCGMSSIKLDGTDFELAKGAAKSLEAMAEKVPYVKNTIKNIHYGGASTGAWASEGVNSINLSEKYYDDKTKFEKSYAECLEPRDEFGGKGFHPQGTDVDTVMVHEACHALAESIGFELRDSHVGFYGTRMFEETLRDDACKHFGTSIDKLWEKVSGYARKNSAELYAEAVSSYICGGTDEAYEVGEYLFKRTEQYIEEIKAGSGVNYDAEEHPHTGVGVVVVNDGKILCATRHNDTGYGKLCGPGGHIDIVNGKPETAETAAIRETQEEFGITPKNLISLGYGNTEGDGNQPFLFLCTEFEGEPECMDLEMVHPQWVGIMELEDLDEDLLYPPFINGVRRLESILGYRSDAKEDERWITTSQGKHIQINAETGEILKGNIGQNRLFVQPKLAKAVKPETIHKLQSVASSIIEEFPGAKGEAKTLSSMGKNEGHERASYNINGVISIPAEKADDPETENSVVHEMGHVLTTAVSRKRKGTERERVEDWNNGTEWGKSSTAQSLIVRAFRSACKETGEKPTEKALNRILVNIDMYGAKTPHEAVSTCFLDYYKNRENAQPISKELWKLFKKELGNERTDAEDGDWVTINGTHVLVGEGGVAMSGGKLKGMNFGRATSTKRQPKAIAMPEAQKKTLDKLCKQTANLKKEQYRIIDKDGNVIAISKGDTGSVGLTVGEKREKLGGNISLHNHPTGGTFSDEDLNEFGFGATAMVISTPEGTYTLKNKKVGEKDQFEGWYGMREELRNSGITDEKSFIDLKKYADEHIKDTDEYKKYKSYSEEADEKLKTMPSDPQEKREWLGEMNTWMEESGYNKAMDDYTKKHKELEREAVVKPYDDFYRENAEKYGFEYTFEPSKKSEKAEAESNA